MGNGHWGIGHRALGKGQRALGIGHWLLLATCYLLLATFTRPLFLADMPESLLECLVLRLVHCQVRQPV